MELARRRRRFVEYWRTASGWRTDRSSEIAAGSEILMLIGGTDFLKTRGGLFKEGVDGRTSISAGADDNTSKVLLIGMSGVGEETEDLHVFFGV